MKTIIMDDVKSTDNPLGLDYSDPATWTKCADEGEHCACLTGKARFG
jgi:hypothetical protein